MFVVYSIPMDPMNILVVVTGATGLVGANVALRLLDNGFRVRCTKRANSKILPALDARKEIEWVNADLKNRVELTEAFRGAT